MKVFAAILAIMLVCPPIVGAAPQQVKGTKVTMEKPAGFSEAPNFSGFGLPEHAASIMVTELPAPYAKTTAGFDQTHMEPRGMHLVSKEDLACGSFSGLLIQLTQSTMGKTFRKWIRVFGDDTKTVMITATFLDEESETLKESMKQAVLSATYNVAAPAPDMMADIPFTISGTKLLKLTTRVQNTLLFTSAGKLQPGGNRGDALFIVGQALSDLDVGDKAVFARRRLKQTPKLSDIEIEKEVDITISGLDGRQILATAQDSQLGYKVFIDQIMLYGLGSYFIMQGIAPAEKRETFEADFVTLAKSFKLK